MFIAYTHKDGPHCECFDTYREAAQAVIDRLGPDYAEDVWIDSGNGRLRQSKRMFDFSATVHVGIKAFLDDQAVNLDYEAMPHVLRALADAIERYAKQ